MAAAAQHGQTCVFLAAAAAELDAWGSGRPRGAGGPSDSSAELGPLGPALQPWSLSEAPTKDADPTAF